MSAVSPGTRREPTPTDDPQVATGLPRRLVAAVLLFSGVLFYVFATHGTLNPLYQQLGAGFADDFFRAQAHAMIHGHLNVKPGQLPGECWLYHNQCLGYFGLTPSLLRLPLIAIRSNTDHTLTAVYLTAALVLAVGAILAIIDLALARVPQTPLTRFWGFALAISLGPGSVLLMLARPAMYEESIAWGTALALVGIYCFLRWWAQRRLRWAFCVLVSMVAAANARPTAVPIAALLGAAIVLESLASHFAWGSRRTPPKRTAPAPGPGEPRRRIPWRDILMGVGIAILPVATVCGVYWLKFHTLVPNQLLNQQVSGPGAQPWWLTLRRLNHNTLVGLRFVPTDLFAYIRPDGLTVHAGFPFVDFRFPYADGVHYIGIPVGSILAERWSTIPDEMPLAVITIIVGGLYALRRHRGGLGVRPAVWAALRSPMTYCIVGGAGAWGESLMQCGITNRYLADAMPLIVVLAALGARVLAPAVAALSGRRATVFVVGVTVLVIASLLVNAGLEYQDWWSTAL